MDRPHAEQLYDSGKEVTVEKLLELDAEIKNLKEKIAQLEKTSQESSKPPSSDFPKDKGLKDKNKEWQQNRSGRKAGGQTGHQGKNRPLVGEDDVDEFNPVRPPEIKTKSGANERPEYALDSPVVVLYVETPTAADTSSPEITQNSASRCPFV